MTDEIPTAPEADGNAPVFTVSELSGALKRVVESDFAHVRVRGELSGVKRVASGHVYLALKDADAVLDGVIWRNSAARLGLVPEDGMEVICTGRLTTYPGRSKYQMVIERLELAGVGALLKILEERRLRLAAEGLFAPARKRPLPVLPGVIGIVTSPTGAVIRDILHRLADRFPRTVLVWPVAVQGETAAAQVARAIEGFNGLPMTGWPCRPDLLIVARGGGSLEDLMPFNEEIVVRAAAASAIPLISAVGHETDTTLIDHAADRRAPTPTAAAELAVPVRLDLLATLATLGGRLDAALSRAFGERRLRLDGLARGLPEPARILETLEQRLDDRRERFAQALAVYLRDRTARVAQAGLRLRHPGQIMAEAGGRLAMTTARLVPALERQIERAAERAHRIGHVLDSLSPFKVLERGYAVVERQGGRAVSPTEITPGMALTLRFAEAEIAARAESGPQRPGEVAARPKRRSAAIGAATQPRLL